MVLVPVRDENAAHLFAGGDKITDVGNDQIDAGKFLVGKGKPRVDDDDVVAVWRCLLMAYSSSCRFALLRLRAALFLFASVFNYREDVALLLCALHCNQQDSPDDNNSGLRVSLYLWKRTYSSLKTVKNIMFAGVFMCPKNRTEVNISPVCRGGNAQNRAVNDTGRLRDTPR